MNVIRREFYNVSRKDTIDIIPLSDVHIGTKACDETLLKRTVKRIDETGAYWVGVGDYCEFINISDPRFNSAVLDDWVQMTHLRDLAAAQRDRFLGFVRPIASKCLGLVCGNHESSILRHYERDIFSDIVAGVKTAGGFKPDHKLSMGGFGWLQLAFYRGGEKKRSGCSIINVIVHHGFVGGRLAGAKALNMQRWLWSRRADLIIFGHSHNQDVSPQAVQYVDRAGRIRQHVRKGCYAGSFMKSSVNGVTTYNETKGYMPLPVGGVEIKIRPFAKDAFDVVRITV